MRVAVPAILIRESRALLAHPPSLQPGLWERAAVLLTRQALENALNDYWRTNRQYDLLKPHSMRAQVLCLRQFLKDDCTAAADFYQLWSALSDACHFDACYPTPSAQEIHVWLDRTDELCALLAHKAGRTAA